MRDTIKTILGNGVAAVAPQARYDDCLFVLAHMRCGSTALSNILCSRPDVSGYGEAHIRYDGDGALGRLVMNQALRRSWTPGASHLFDKILHSRHDAAACEAFHRARVIFVARRPEPTIRSVRALYARLGRSEYGSDLEAAQYYVERLDTLLRIWLRFAAGRRIGLTSETLMAQPDAALDRISRRLAITPPLANRYESRAASRRGGAGDPLVSARYTRIEPRQAAESGEAGPLDLPGELLERAQALYARFETEIACA